MPLCLVDGFVLRQLRARRRGKSFFSINCPKELRKGPIAVTRDKFVYQKLTWRCGKQLFTKVLFSSSFCELPSSPLKLQATTPFSLAQDGIKSSTA